MEPGRERFAGSSYNTLNAIDADSQNSLWAVGRGKGTLTARWNGVAFAAVASANAGTGANELKSISAVNANDIWAVGNAAGDPLTMHWDGTSWTIVPTPSFTEDAFLEGVTAIASNDVWAVGFQSSPASVDSSNVILHWNGTAWSVVASPNPGGNSLDKLHDVKAVGPNDIYAVGEYKDRTGKELATILHWNGAVWTVVPNSCSPLFGITVISASDIWAVGYSTCHYDGTSWTPISIPAPPSGGGVTLQDVSAVSTNDVWAVGTSVFCDGFGCYFSPYAIHWDGTQWRLTTVPAGSSLSGVEAQSAKSVTAVGTYSLGTLIIRWNGKSWKTVPSPDPEVGGELNEITSTRGKLWSVGSFFDSSYDQRTLVLDNPSATQGTVTGSTGVSGAIVSWFGPVTGSTTTDIFGNYAAAGLPAGSYTFVASADGCSPGIATVQVIAGKTVTQNITINCP